MARVGGNGALGFLLGIVFVFTALAAIVGGGFVGVLAMCFDLPFWEGAAIGAALYGLFAFVVITR